MNKFSKQQLNKRFAPVNLLAVILRACLATPLRRACVRPVRAPARPVRLIVGGPTAAAAVVVVGPIVRAMMNCRNKRLGLIDLPPL